MSFHAFLEGPMARFWHDWHAALIAFAVALAVRLGAVAAGRMRIALQAPAAGAVAGWGVLAYGHATSWPLDNQGKLLALGGLAVVSGVAAGSLGKAGQALTLLLAIFASWFILGMPIDAKDLLAILAQATILAALCGLTIMWLRHANAWTVVLAALALWVNLTIAGAAAFWPMAAACIAAASLALLGRGGGLGGANGGDELGIAAVIGFAVATADLTLGKLRQDGFTIMDMACCAPLLTGFVAPRLGQNDIVLGSLVGAIGSTVLLWAIKTFS